jgi:uncharacterized protein
MTTNYNVLCCDGGGIRGLLTAIILQNLPSSALANTTVFAGTSTGGIISLALAAGIPVQTVVDLYSGQCSSIFNPADSPAATFDEIWQYIYDTFDQSRVLADILAPLAYAGIEVPINAFSAKYTNTSLISQLTTTLNTSPLGYGADTMISAIAAKVFITTFQLSNASNQWQPISIDNLNTASSNDSSLLEAALATSAAPTYFPPYNHSLLGYCIDGGTFANNPSTFVLARILQSGVPASSIRMLSIGTGATANAIPSSYFSTVQPELWGSYQYMMPLNPPPSVPSETLINLMMDGSSEVDDTQTGEILTGRYLRVEVPLTSPVTLDACSEVPTLTSLASSFVGGSSFQPIVQWMKENFV